VTPGRTPRQYLGPVAHAGPTALGVGLRRTSHDSRGAGSTMDGDGLPRPVRTAALRRLPYPSM
jgi:hypothetical protein